MVGLTESKAFSNPIKFDKINTNVGGGYIDDDSNADCGKFIAPQNGTYQFNVNVHNDDKTIGANLIRNTQFVLGTKNGNEGAGSLNAILDLKEKDQVYLIRPPWVSDTTKYDQYFTSFSGFLMRVDI